MTGEIHGLLSSLGRASWQGALVFLVIWLLCQVLAKRLTADAQCWLWRLSYIKLLAGLLWGGTILLPLLSPTPPPRFAEPPPIVTYQAERAAAEAKWSHAAANVSVAAPTPKPTPEPKPKFDWREALAVAYLAGVLVCLGRLLLAARWTQRALLSTVGGDVEREMSLMRDLARSMNLRRIPSVARAPVIDSPVYIAGRILLPAEARYSNADLRMILAHELAHARRHDLSWEWLGTLVQVLFFFHPLVVLARREERLARESAADALALAATNVSAADYGKMLLSLVLAPSGKRPMLTGAVGVIENGSLLRRRLLALREASHRVSRRTQWRIALTLAPLVLLVFVPWKMILAQAQTPKMPTGDKSFTGIVSDEAGKPVEGITVNLISSWPQPLDMRGATRSGGSFLLPAGSVVRSRLKSITDAQGRFAFTHLPAGHYDYYFDSRKSETVLSDPGQYIGIQAALEMSKADSQKPIRVMVSKGSLVTGRVVDGDTGQPMSGIFVNAGAIPPGANMAKSSDWAMPHDGITDAQGRYQIRVPPGNISVGVGRAYNSIFSQRVRYAVQKVTVQPGQTASAPDLSVFLHPVIVFVGPDGKPLANTMVRLTPAAKTKGTYIWGLTLGDYTDHSGTVVLGRSDFQYRFENGAFSIQKDGRSASGTFAWSPHHPLVIVINGHSTSYPSGIGTVQLTERSSSSLVTGTVVSEDGTPIPNAQIRFAVAYPKRHYGLMDQVFQTDNSGVFRAAFKLNGEYHAYVRADGFNEVLVSDGPLAIVPGKSTSLGTIHLVRAEGSVSGKVVDSHGKPMRGVLAFVEGGKTFLSGAVTDPEGNFRVPNVVEGEALTLRLSRFGIAPDSGVPLSYMNEEMEWPAIQASPTERQIVWHSYHEAPWQHRGRPF